MSIDPAVYWNVREHVGLFDASRAYGRLAAHGKDAIDLLHRMSTNDLKPLEQLGNASVFTFLTNEKGRIIDLIDVVREASGETILITSAGKEEAVVQWLDKFTIMEDARFDRATEKVALFELIGPKADLTVGGGGQIKVTASVIQECPITILRTGVKRLFVLTSSEHSQRVWNALKEKVSELAGAIVDSELYEVLRIEDGIPKAPNELNERHNPLETPIANDAVSFTKGCYIGQEVIARLDAQQKVQRHLVGLHFEDGTAQPGDRIVDPETPESAPLGNEIGEVTSSAHSPHFGAIGLGYVRGKYANPGTRLSVKAQNGNIIAATLVTLPFHD